MNGTSQHLTLEELTGDAELSAAAREHLATCAGCGAEARDWAAVARGARLIVSASQPSPPLLGRVLNALDAAPRTRRNWRRALPYAAAAAAVVLAGTGYTLAGTLGSTAPQAGHVTTMGLTATGCTGLDLAAGTLTAVNGDDLVIRTASGRTVTVTTSAATTLRRVEAGSTSDIADGAQVLVTGTSAAGTLTATSVTIMPGTVTQPQSPGGGLGAAGLVAGTVADASASGFTVVAADGTRYAVTVSDATTVITTASIGAGQLQLGETTTASGTAGPGGTLTASTVEQLAVPAATWRKLRPPIPSPPPGVPTLKGLATPDAPGSGGLALNSLGCTPAAVSTSYLLTSAD
jgi:hypothetical protein